MIEYDQLCEKIKQLPCFDVSDDDSLSITQIEAGQSSSCFDVLIQSNKDIPSERDSSLSIKELEPAKVNLTTKRYFVKYDANSTLFENELKTSKAAAKIDLSPSVIYAEKNWLVNKFIQAESLNNSSSDIKSKIEIAVKLMKQCHTLDVSLPEFDASEIITHIIASKSFSITQQEHIRLLINNMTINVEGPQNERVLCHGDMNFSNIMTSKNKAWLIDFECSCVADKEFEVAMFMAINFLNEDQQAYTVACYEKDNYTNNIKIDQNKLTQYLSYAYLINGLWYFDKVKEMQGSTLGCKKDVFYELATKQLTLFDKMNPAHTVLSQLFT